jgi:hypothetical protein
MPSKIVDLSAKSEIIKNEPWHLHFWECSPTEYLNFLKNPREFLQKMDIDIPEDCRIETCIENHDWMSKETKGLSEQTDDGPIVICNVGGGNIARPAYKISSYAHRESDVGKFRKKLLHESDLEEKQ